MNILKKILILVFVCPASTYSSDTRNMNYEAWLGSVLLSADEILCKEVKNGNYYFVAKNGDRFKVGARVFLFKEFNSMSDEYTFSWQVKNQDGHYITTRGEDRRKFENNELIKQSNGYYSNSVDFIYLTFNDVVSFKVSYLYGKVDSKKYIDDICEVAVIKDKEIILINKKNSTQKVAFAKPKYSRIVGLIYPDSYSTEFLKKVLDSMSLGYEEKETANGKLVEWLSEDEAQELEIQNRVSQYSFIREVCNNKEVPSPSQPSRKKLSCKN